MKNNPYNVIITISSSSLSRCQKLVLITLYAQAAGGNNCTICLADLHRLTSTSPRHLSRIIKQLSNTKILKTIRHPGQCNTYHLPSTLDLHTDGSLIATYHSEITDNSQDAPSPVPPHQPPKNDFTPDKDLIIAWQKTFNERHQPVNQKEQDAMDFMLWAHLNHKIGEIKLPTAYVKTIARNGHTTDFTPFQKRNKKLQKQKVSKKKKIMKQKKEQKQKDDLWLTYKQFDKAKKETIKKDFEQIEIKRNQPKIVKDIFARDGFENQMISALYKHYVCHNKSILQGAKR